MFIHTISLLSLLSLDAAVIRSMFCQEYISEPCPASCPTPQGPAVSSDGIDICVEDILSNYRDCSFRGYMEWSGSDQPLCNSTDHESPQYFTLSLEPLQGSALMTNLTFAETSTLSVKFTTQVKEDCELYAGTPTMNSGHNCSLNLPVISNQPPFDLLARDSLEWSVPVFDLLAIGSIFVGFAGNTSTANCGSQPESIIYDNAKADFIITAGFELGNSAFGPYYLSGSAIAILLSFMS